MTVLNEQRDELRLALTGGDIDLARHIARSILRVDAGVRQFKFIRKCLDATPETSGLVSIRVALLSSFSIEFIHDSLVVLGFLRGLKVTVHQTGFAQYAQEILNENSQLYSTMPDVVVLALEGKDFLPEAYRHDVVEGMRSEIRAIGEVHDLCSTLRQRTAVPILIHNYARAPRPSLGILDGQLATGQSATIERANAALRAMCSEIVGTYLVDYAGLVERTGSDHWYDRRMEHFAKAPIALTNLPILSAEYVKFFCAFKGLTKKCIVLDLDNTLWGGVLGEDGVEGVQLGATYPGSAFREFQEWLLGLYHQGILLAVASKNNESDVDEMFARKDQMILHKDHFAALQINWQPKSVSIRQIADDLGIGLQHMVFVDDNAFEVAEVTSALPMVSALQLPTRAEDFVEAVASEGWFDQVKLTEEDRARADLYRRRARGEALRRSAGSLEEFYRSLELCVAFLPPSDGCRARMAQLTQKTNQFNATTKRYTESEVRSLETQPRWFLRAVSVRDRFGDHGIVGVMIAEETGQDFQVDTLLLSCRVIGRTIETAMLSVLAEEGKKRGCDRMCATIVETPKNVPVRDLFSRHAFEGVLTNQAGETRWAFDLRQSIEWPEWIERQSGDEESA